MRLLSPRDSQILPNSCRCRGYQCKWCYRTQVGVRRGFRTLLCVFSGRSVVDPSWGDRDRVACWVIFYFDAVVGPWVFGWCNVIYVLDWRGECKPTMFLPFYYLYYMGCCEDCLTCDIAFNAVMPLSRASTHGSYSRIEGVTLALPQPLLSNG